MSDHAPQRYTRFAMNQDLRKINVASAIRGSRMGKLCGLPALLLLTSLLAAQTRSGASANVVVIRHVTVIDTAGGPEEPDRTVIITGDRISRISRASEAAVPAGAKVVDATGKFLIPGLWDMHVHPDGKGYLQLFIANGVTGIRIMWGDPAHYEWRKQIEAGQLIGPRMSIASAIIDGPKPFWRGSIAVSNEKEARQAVDDAKQEGADFVKVYQFLPREEYLAIASEAKKEDIPFVGHVPISVTALEASEAGQKSFEHLIGVLPICSTRNAELFEAEQADLAEDLAGKPAFWGTHYKQTRQMMLDTYSPEKVAALSAVLKRNGTWQVPTLVLLHMFAFGDDAAFLNDARLKYMPMGEKASWNPSAILTPEDFVFEKKEFQKDLEVVGAMQKAGIGILAGTDTSNPYCFPGFSLHDELGFLVQAGLSPMQALQAATLNPARYFGKEKDFGTVEVGKIADLVLLNANPLDDIGNTRKIDAVVFAGRVFDRSQLDAMLQNVEALASLGETLLNTTKEKGADAAVAQYRELKSAHPEAYDSSEDELNGLGYQLIRMKRLPDAIKIFKLNVEAYPQSYNAYDSLGESYMYNGDKQLAIQNYEKSLQLNPRNENAVRMLKKLNSQ